MTAHITTLHLSLLSLLLSALLSMTGADVVLIGGGLTDTNTEVVGKFIELAGGPGVANIGVITTASATPDDSATYYEELFTAYGAASVTWIPVTETSGNADTAEVADLVSQQSGLFLGGGDQARIFTAWVKPDGTDSMALSALRGVIAAGGVVGGTSAGAACQGTGPMIAGGLSYNALMYGAYAGGYNPDYPDDLCYIENGGLGLVSGFVVETHSSQRGREGRIIQLLLDTKTSDPSTHFAIALDEDTGVHIDTLGNAELLGTAGGALIVDVSSAVEDTASEHTKVAGVRTTFLTEDDKFNIYTGEITYPAWKSDLIGNEFYNEAVSSNNIFSSPDKPIREYSVFRDTAHRLWDSKSVGVTSYSFEKNPQFSVLMSKAGGTAFGGYSPATDTFVVTYANMEVNIDYVLQQE